MRQKFHIAEIKIINLSDSDEHEARKDAKRAQEEAEHHEAILTENDDGITKTVIDHANILESTMDTAKNSMDVSAGM